MTTCIRVFVLKCVCVSIRHTLHDGDDGLVSMQNGKHWQFDVIKCPFTEKLFNEFNCIENERWISMLKSCVNHNMKTSTCTRILKTINGANVENGFSSAKNDLLLSILASAVTAAAATT